jgi:predicted DCC family thiol-disulfide oxidoreductase YuxK
VEQWRERTVGLVDFAAYQDVADQYPQVDRAALSKAAHLVEADDRISRGAEAIFRMLAIARRKRYLRWGYDHIPGFAALSETGYRIIAASRPLLSLFMSCAVNPTDDSRALRLTSWVFLRAIDIIYLLAFGSLLPQILGLVGSHGILPARNDLPLIAAQLGRARWWEFPTLCWLDSSDAFIRGLCITGMVLSGLLILDIAPALVLALLWICYLSITHVGSVFLNFQWDALLLEAGLLAIFLAPLHLRPKRGQPASPSLIVVWLLRWLLFRLMLLSGVVKLASGDPVWRDLSALTVHYETQPLSNWVAWHFHQMPLWFSKLSCGIMFLIELALPFFIFMGRFMRRIAFGGLVFLQVMIIIITGNYGFFNLLTLALCLLLLDDGAWPRRLRLWHARNGVLYGWRWPAWLMAPAAAMIVLLTTIPALRRVDRSMHWPETLMEVYRATTPFRCFNSYGLFAAMTHSRPEIVVEGSDDGLTWKAYEFRYKPGELTRAPPFVAPHMPRLDWQMWFAALGQVQRERWFVYFCKRLLEGSPEVLGLMATNPFADRPPKYVRALLYDYRFTDRATRLSDGSWWMRELKGVYCPPLDLDFFRRRGFDK